MATSIRVGIGGWEYAPWRQTFYPPGVTHKKALAYASRQVTSIEINGTYYRTAKPEHFAAWHAQTPDDFVFSVKASRYASNRRVLAEAGESVERFVHSGLAELGDKLGPLLWQLAPTKQFDPDDLAAFFKLLPAKLGTRKLRHVLDVRHPSFMCEEYLKLARKHKVATVFADAPDLPSFADVTGNFVYARLLNARSARATGYTKPALKQWAETAGQWQQGGTPAALPLVGAARDSSKPRDVFIYFINGAKERAPAAAQHLLGLL
ncbi:hypothetical protein ASF61_09995 [Duganella sp. Leaf126]|uniref:DUF72 domain-containing protein n=1 Tax=Duganella sp. Leaf126 TaxID=1736266 RepID=UPI0006FD8F79|nr:DUF72 domain-containing protein [Duganella sp. Leaf126]KQQ33404.1 hypothetical protein ASF61_09995 [Duganella sp. Leaf126]